MSIIQRIRDLFGKAEVAVEPSPEDSYTQAVEGYKQRLRRDEEEDHRTSKDLEEELAAAKALRDRTLAMQSKWFPELAEEKPVT